MRDFLLDDEDRVFRAELDEFCSRELAKRVGRIETDASWDELAACVRTVGAAGYIALMFPDIYQGSLARPGLRHATMLAEEVAQWSYALEATVATSASCAYPLHRHACSDLRERYLPAVVEGRSTGAICVTERDVGSDSSRMSTRITYDATTDEWVLNGFKRYISNASVADVYVVYGITNDAVPAQRGMSAIVVPGDAPGISFPRRYHLMGRRGCVVGEVELRDCRVPRDHLIGEVDDGYGILLGMFNFERIILAGSGLGVARSAFAIATAHARERVSFGAPLGTKQLVWDRIAEMSWRIDATELLAYRAAKLYDAGGLSGKELAREASMAKLVATETAVFCADSTVQILGGDGLTREYGRAEQIYRDARALTIVGGTSEVVKYLVASAALPGLKLNL